MSGPTRVFENQWGDKLEFYEKFLKMIINDRTKIFSNKYFKTR